MADKTSSEQWTHTRWCRARPGGRGPRPRYSRSRSA